MVWWASWLWCALTWLVSCVVCDRPSCGVWRSCLFEESEKQQRERVVIMVMIWAIWTRSEKTWTGWISLSDAWLIKDCVCDEHEWHCCVMKFIEQEQEFQFLWISLNLFSGIGTKIWIKEARGKIDEDSTVLWVFEGRWCDRKHHFISGYEELAIGLGRGCSWCFKRLQLLFWLFFLFKSLLLLMKI